MTSPVQSSPAPARRRRKDARPGEILDAALAEFSERGFGASTLSGIARRAGVARPTIYLYFDDKDALFDALMQRRLTDTLEEIRADLDGYTGDSGALLEMLFTRMHADAADPEAVTLLRVLIAEGRRFPKLVRLHHQRVMDVGVTLLQEIVARGVTRGEFAPDAAEIDVRVLVAPVLMALFWRTVFWDVAPLDGEKILRDQLRVVLRALGARGPER
ncbi:MAG: TetR/AcrR family transcriptional regulator [Pseudomonadota bacterium]